MKNESVSLMWLPPSAEWDFRSVTEAECRMACYWEYARDMRPHLEPGTGRPRLLAKKRGQMPGKLRDMVVPVGELVKEEPVTKSPLFPKAWSSLTAEERAGVMASVEPFRALRVRSLNDTIEKARWALVENSDMARRYRRGAYVIWPSFSVFGVEAVIRELKAWARREARNYPRSPRAKAAEPPFDLLKWLAVWRLESKRKQAGITYEAAQESLQLYRTKNRRQNPNDVFPAYTAHGAWAKARRDAERIRTKVFLDQCYLLRDWCVLY